MSFIGRGPINFFLYYFVYNVGLKMLKKTPNSNIIALPVR